MAALAIKNPLYVVGKTNYSLGDCVTFRGLLNLIALRREGEQYVFKLVRSCLFTQPAEDNFIVLNMCFFFTTDFARTSGGG